MIFDSGMVTVCNLLNTAEPGSMPKEALVPVLSALFGERTVGYGRFYHGREYLYRWRHDKTNDLSR